MPEQRHSPRLEQVRAVKARELHKEAREALINDEPNEVILQKLTKAIQATKLCSSSTAQQIERESIDAFP
jgi:hypothetical protein|uniref:Uncharacterized protein n=1 Tax=viral metagenome TaxID=1070528 RepID=A0A6C0KX50_9ZZZZ